MVRKVRNRRRKVKKSFILLVCLLLLILIFICFKLNFNKADISVDKIDYKKIAKNNYHDNVIATSDIAIYNQEYIKVGIISKNSKLKLDGITDVYYKLDGTSYLISYDDLEEYDEKYVYSNIKTEYETYKNYIPYNINIVTNNHFKLSNDSDAIEINDVLQFPVIIKMPDKYGVEFNDKLFYIDKADVLKEVEYHNSDGDVASKVPVLNYHYTVNREAGELKECRQEICTEDVQVEEEIKYISDNNYYTLTMQDLYLYLNGYIQIPKKSVTITIDDGWYVSRMISILEKYKKNGTLFLIGSLETPASYKSEYLEIHSHSWNMHNIGDCSGSHHGGAILCFPNDKILEDLKKSRESLNNTDVFCYPFYEYNQNAINMLKQAGFKMSFVGGERSAKVGDDLFKIPRYVIVNYTTMSDFIDMLK